MLTKKNSLVVPGTLESLSALRQYTMDACTTAGLTKDQAYGLSLAIDEIATNIMVHGYGKNGLTGNISIVAEITDENVTLVMEDTSPEFDARKLAVPPAESLKKPLEERPIGGLGVYLTLQNVDRFDYQRIGGVNRNSFIIKRAKK
ncbi:MAG: anti-sigma regulatory factor [Kiritimatiellae bacterium]|nr:anti-sigma regulatory factor [Kiritimatiellia bacterium]MDD5519754.1 anti-sigma regulatory factor [Kiritimatiellia bacterium]